MRELEPGLSHGVFRMFDALLICTPDNLFQPAANGLIHGIESSAVQVVGRADQRFMVMEFE